MMSILPLLAAAAALSCHAVDGDTLRCGRERVRLTGIDAPEMPDHCARYRKCAPGNPFASRDSLTQAMRGGSIRIDRVGKDHYGRTLAVVYAGGRNVACVQLERGHAIYKPNWDNGGRIARECRASK